MKLLFYIANTVFQILNRKRYTVFKKSIENPEEAQLKVLQSIINSNKDCEIGQKFSFRNVNSVIDFQQLVPLTGYADYELFISRIMAGEKNILCSEEIDYLALSSGTSAPSKYIPYTKTLKKQFNTTLNAWIYYLLKDNPKIKYGSQFWIITPVITIDQKDSKIPVGFENDSSYFGVIEKRLINCIMAVPNNINKVKDRENYFYLLCYFLLQNRNLRLISIWNPSLLITITDFLKSNFSVLVNDMIHGTLSLPNPDVKSDYELFRNKIRKNRKRAIKLIYAMENGSLNIKKIWPNLELISCWTDSWARIYISDIQDIFPDVKIQGKGLLSTEAVITIPIGDFQYPVLSVNAHFYEFKNIAYEKIYLAHELEIDNEYEVYITTGGGLYRYSLNDIVRVKGFYLKTPTLEFIGKKDKVSDFTGEKVNEEHVRQIIDVLSNRYFEIGGLVFLGIQKYHNAFAYVLYIQKDNLRFLADFNSILNDLDRLLCENFHYKNSRQMKQLAAPGLVIMEMEDKEKYLAFKSKKEVKSTFKLSVLETDFELLLEVSKTIIWKNE